MKNMLLSKRRALAVHKFFIKHVKKQKKIKYTFKGWGPNHPIADNSSKEERDKNSRIEITFMRNHDFN